MAHLHSDHRRILLLDHNSIKLNLRATVLRNYEIEVHTATGVKDAESFWNSYCYDLVLLDAQDSEEATKICAQIREKNPAQRIGLLVGPPAFVQELGALRKKAKSVSRISPEKFDQPAISPNASTPQWQETVRKVVSDWYLDKSAQWGLRR